MKKLNELDKVNLTIKISKFIDEIAKEYDEETAIFMVQTILFIKSKKKESK